MRVLPLLVLGLLACDRDLERPDRAFGLDQAPGSYVLQSDLVAFECPEGAPPLLADPAPVEVRLDGTTMTVTGLTPTVTGTLDLAGSFALDGAWESPLGPTSATLAGVFLRPDEGRGFVATLEEAAPGCRQRYRVRAF